MTRLPDHFSRRLDGRAGDMAQLPEPECSQSTNWWVVLGIALCAASAGLVAVIAYLIF